MAIEDLILSFFNRFESFNSIIQIVGYYIFPIGFLVFIIAYLKRLRDHLSSWEDMTSFGQIVFILLLGIASIVPILLFTLLFFFIGIIGYEVGAPHTCGQMMDYLGLIFYGIAFLFLVYISFKFKLKKIGIDLLIQIFSLWKPFKYIFWLDLLLLVIVLVFGALTNCIYFG